MNPNNPLQKSLEESYFEGGKDYQYGGYIPPIVIEGDITNTPTPTKTNTPTPTKTSTPTPTPTSSLGITPTPTTSPTGTPTQTPTRTSTPTPTPTPAYDLYDAENCCSPFDTITIGLLSGTIYNQDAGVEYGGSKYVIIGNGSGVPVILSSTTIDIICSTISCPSPTPTPTSSITPTPTISPGTTQTPTPSITPTISLTATRTPTPTPTISVSPTQTPTQTPSGTPTQTPTKSPTPTPTTTPTISNTPTSTPTNTPTPSSSAPIPQPISMNITGTGNFSGFTGTWLPSQLINKVLYSTITYPTYSYFKFRSFGASAMLFYNQSSQQMLRWGYNGNPQIPCFGVGIWSFERTFTNYPTFPVETLIGVYKNTIPLYFCGVVNTINALGWVPQGTYTTGYGNVVVSYNY